MKKMLLFTSLLVVGVTTLGETVKGVVLDENKEPIVGAEINTNGKTYYTDFDGKFELDTDDETITVSMVSYRDMVVETSCCDTIIMGENHH
jgi:hypothetical protein